MSTKLTAAHAAWHFEFGGGAAHGADAGEEAEGEGVTLCGYQIVWWGWRDLAWWLPREYEGGMALVYRWSMWIGPVEIRRWASKEQA